MDQRPESAAKIAYSLRKGLQGLHFGFETDTRCSYNVSDDSEPLIPVHIRLFADDVALVKKIAATKRIPWQTELRLTIHRALKGTAQEVIIVKDQT